MRTIHRAAGVATAAAALVSGLALSAPGAAQAQPQASATAAPKVFTWSRSMSSGDCTMIRGAKWTLYPDGTAYFDGTVGSSAGDDAWLMWARLKDENGAVLGSIVNANAYDPKDRTKFAMNLRTAGTRYRWFASGRFNPALFDLVERMSMAKHC
ncbi:DUF6294 family protein [Thermoactinospora rubra]|uniref:DUF6294 family protein n=1 Tax=Thermoactinospora rubra TaxID=1088767 RepID=UPI000A107CE6|nr:DUF6294 family protein [Thermoactinospora rubra]